MSDPIAVRVDDAHVTYRIQGRGTRAGRNQAKSESRSNRRSVHAVAGISFVAHEAETIGLIGRNGSGKSSLLRAVAGLMPLTSGSITASSVPVLLGVGSALKGDLTGRQNIMLGASALGVRRRAILGQLDEIIEFSGLQESIDYPFRTYSSGMKARLQFSISTAVRPSILLVDEALAVGDEEFKVRSNERIQELIGGASTVFLVSHSLSAIEERCDRVLWMDRGRQVMWGAAGEVVAGYTQDTKDRKGRKARQNEAERPLENASAKPTGSGDDGR